MHADRNTVVRNAERLTKDRAKALLASGLQRAVATRGKDQVALAAGCGERCIEKALAQDTLPSIETVLNALDADETIMDELLAARGRRLCSLRAEAANDMALAAGVTIAMGQLVQALTDGIRDHTETLTIADLLRPHLPAMNAIVREADGLRGAA